jgi:hypothetical protein
MTPRFERRYGMDDSGPYPEIGRPGSMNTDADPSDLAPNEFSNLVNARRRGGRGFQLKERGGQLPVNPTALHNAGACVYPTQFDYGTPRRAWIAGDGCPTQSNTVGFWIGHYDIDQSPRFQAATWYKLAAQKAQITGYGGTPFLMVDNQLRRFNLLQVPYGTTNLAIAGGSQDVPLYDFATNCSAMQEFDGLLFIALANGEIWTWDGRTARLDRTDAGNVVQSFGVWRDFLVATYPAATNRISLRTVGDSPGSWSNVAPGAGTVPGVEGNTIMSYKDNLYLVGGTPAIWKYDGTTLAVVHTPASAVDVHTLANAFGFLYFGYKQLIVANRAIIGRFDGTTWTDVHKDFVPQRNTSQLVRAMVLFKNNLLAAINNSGLVKAYAYLSPADDTANAAWEEVTADGADIRYFVVI